MAKLTKQFSFNEQSLNQFDSDLASIGYHYEGTLDECLWIYRNGQRSVNIQVGDGGVVAASLCLTLNNRVKQTDLSIKGIKNGKRLFNWICQNLGQPIKY